MRISDWSSDVCSSDLRETFNQKSRSSSPALLPGPSREQLQERNQMTGEPYVPPRVWTWDAGETGGAFASINRPIAGATHEKDLPIGEHPLQLYSLATPNGQKETIMQLGRASCRERVWQYV